MTLVRSRFTLVLFVCREIFMLSVSERRCTHIPNSWLFRSHCPTKQSEIGACESVLLEHPKRCREDHQTPRHGWESLGGLSTKMSLPWSAQLLRFQIMISVKLQWYYISQRIHVWYTYLHLASEISCFFWNWQVMEILVTVVKSYGLPKWVTWHNKSHSTFGRKGVFSNCARCQVSQIHLNSLAVSKVEISWNSSHMGLNTGKPCVVSHPRHRCRSISCCDHLRYAGRERQDLKIGHRENLATLPGENHQMPPVLIWLCWHFFFRGGGPEEEFGAIVQEAQL